MWTRSELKFRAKNAMRCNYWSCVVVGLILAIVTGSSFTSQLNQNDVKNISDSYSMEGLITMMAIGSIVGIVILLLQIFVGNVLVVGGCRFFVDNQREATPISRILLPFKNGGYGNAVLGLFLRDIFIVLWTLLLIVPGIIKSYEYRMVPYILAENPQMGYKEAFKISKDMMNGQKMNLFVMDLSFIGWWLLSAITFGILALFYVQPYYQATMAEVYSANKQIAFDSGVIR